MSRQQKTERNKEMVFKRLSDPVKWSIAKLGDHYKIGKRAVWEILQRDVPVYQKEFNKLKKNGLVEELSTTKSKK